MNAMLEKRLTGLTASDRRLLLSMAGVAIAALLIGIAGGLLTALTRSGFIDVLPEAGYRFLTLHGVSTFFYWLYLAQGVILLSFAAAENGGRLRGSSIAWTGFLLIVAGFLLSIGASLTGTPLLYDGNPEMAIDQPGALALFNLGYVLLGLGLLAIPVCAIRTLLVRRADRDDAALSAVGFALFTWGGFLMVSGFAAIYVFLPGLAWSLGVGPIPGNHGTNWHILFHNMHYLPLMATVIVWYVLMQELTGVKSIFGERFSKIVFAMYLIFVPPTSLYHMFLEPDLPGGIRIAGSVLSLLVSVPTLTAFLIIVASLEVHARARGGRGVFGWIMLLPWRNPAMAAAGFAVVNMGLGIVLAFVLIQEKLAPLLSDTFFVPAYFHFFTVGTVSLSFLAALLVLLPALTGRSVPAPVAMRWMPQVATFGLLIFGGAGVAAGYIGVPRRVIDIGYAGEAPAAWAWLMGIVAAGGTVMAIAIGLLGLSLAACLLPRRRSYDEAATHAWGGSSLRPGASALVGPLSVLVIVAAMYGFTAIGFEMMKALPLGAIGGGHGH
jgi:cytochrome c oxidase subunit 1